MEYNLYKNHAFIEEVELNQLNGNINETIIPIGYDLDFYLIYLILKTEMEDEYIKYIKYMLDKPNLPSIIDRRVSVITTFNSLNDFNNIEVRNTLDIYKNDGKVFFHQIIQDLHRDILFQFDSIKIAYVINENKIQYKYEFINSDKIEFLTKGTKRYSKYIRDKRKIILNTYG